MRSHQSKPCKFCWKLFLTNSLISHMEICSARTEIKKIKCHICPFECERKQNLKSHILSIHIEPKEKKEPRKIETERYSCNICKKEFTQKKLLEQHSADHLNAYECTVCYKKFPRKFSLTRHMNTEHLKKKLDIGTGFGIFEEENVKYSVFECNMKNKKDLQWRENWELNIIFWKPTGV